ncbi:MAG: putative porin [Flavobacteriaceae bacterium]|nr:putative porin [Flavobacteriaceae bacterium]
MFRIYLFIILSIFGTNLIAQISNELDSLNSNKLNDFLIKNNIFQNIKIDTITTIEKDSLDLKVLSKSNNNQNTKEKDSLKLDSLKIDMYKIMDYKYLTTYVDTTISVLKDYKMNYLRRDYFELLPFANTGHAFNRMGYDFFKRSVIPQMGARSKHYGYTERNEIKYYEVPTPLSEMFFKTTFEQGQLLDALVAVNTSPNFNYSLGYRGMRSLGKYLDSRSNNGNFIASFLIKNKNQSYFARIHYNSQRIDNQENGGITPTSLKLFEEGDSDFLDRSVIDNRLKNTESQLTGKRYYIDQYWKILGNNKEKDIDEFNIGNEFTYETKSYRFIQSAPDSFFGDAFIETKGIYDIVKLGRLENKFYAKISNSFVGDFLGSIEINKSKYFFKSIYISDSGIIPNKLNSDQIFLNTTWNKKLLNLDFEFDFKKTFQSKVISDHFLARILFKNNTKFNISASAGFRSQNPDYNFILYQSGYKNYNWYNPEFINQRTSHFSLDISHHKLGEINFLFQNIDNYTYYSTRPSVFEEIVPTQNQLNLIALGIELPEERPDSSFFVDSKQENRTINYLKLRYKAKFNLGKFSFFNTIQYQKSGIKNIKSNISNSLNVPELIIRSTISFTSDVFDKAMKLNTGVSGQYFTEYYADRYNPLLGDFTNQNEFKIGGYPRIDFFINAKVQQTRLYLKAEHINSSITGYNFFSAPYYPYRDFSIRFGLVWNFFR